MKTFDEYQEAALRTAGAKCKGSLAYSMGGVGGEAGEYVDVIKKHLFHDVPYAESRMKALKELGDVLWGLAQAADAWGASLSEVAGANIAKLEARYPRGWNATDAAAKADEHDAAVNEAIAGSIRWFADETVGLCFAKHEGGALCTRPLGHAVEHIGASTLGHIWARWPVDASKAKADEQPATAAPAEQVTRWADPDAAYRRVFNAPRVVEKTMLPPVEQLQCTGVYSIRGLDPLCATYAPCELHGCTVNYCECVPMGARS